MAFFDLQFRRGKLATPAKPKIPLDQKASAAPGAVQAGGSRLYHWCFFIHKWTGLFGAAWLAVLGLTGFFLDHPSWRWQYQAKAPTWLTTQSLEQSARRGVANLLQIDPADRDTQLAGGPRGLWFTSDGGEHWSATVFPKGDHPATMAIEPDPAIGWDRLWLATDDGVYVSEDNGASARPVALSGKYVTALTAGTSHDEMIGVIDKSEVFGFKTNSPDKVEFVEFSAPEPAARPVDVQLNRFVRELHFGRGVHDQMSSLVMNDIGGLGMFILSITGLLYWGLPKYWKYRAKSQSKGAAGAKSAKASKAVKKGTIQWLFRIHSATLGIASVLMLLYLAITGIFIGHGRELGDWMKATRIPQAYLTPAFGIPSWKGWIDAIVAYPDTPGAFTIGNRVGLFTTVDSGQSWAREDGADGKPLNTASRLRRLGDEVMIVNGMAGPSIIRGADMVNHEVAPTKGGEGRGGGEGGRGAADPGQRRGMGGMSGGHGPAWQRHGHGRRRPRGGRPAIRSRRRHGHGNGRHERHVHAVRRDAHRQ